ncbi:phytanoyl-CoA dioxygenase family protein [Phenylobacterium sp.]|uniref:phytanoyl-CoA dioxygenase family protein n=1 Tax=Phenylobacterium sp. TaxID=1871053 RepID=UPI001207FD60|nr:phytanoyl-CoA dioxygenase family protein [Phenylobacterium sp.]THD51690.1 MAG: phytanoyl-CoA dioxygenase family protein [Phenylobacterium sp.]
MPPEVPQYASGVTTLDAPSACDAALWLQRLQQDGYCIIRGLLSRDLTDGLIADLAERFERTPFCEGDFYGGRTKRFGGVLKRSARAEALVRHPMILEIVQGVLGPYCDRFQLNLTQALQIYPGQDAQPPHRDQDMWGGAKGAMEYLVNVMWPFSPYRRENGATVIYPQSHNTGPGDAPPVFAEMDPGDVLLFLGSTLHGGGANISDAPRSGMIVSYSLGWLKPYENQWLVYPPEVARAFSPALARLVGYQQHRPNLGNYEGRCPSVLLEDAPVDFLGAVDELLPHQQEALRAKRAAMRGGVVSPQPAE